MIPTRASKLNTARCDEKGLSEQSLKVERQTMTLWLYRGGHGCCWFESSSRHQTNNTQGGDMTKEEQRWEDSMARSAAQMDRHDAQTERFNEIMNRLERYLEEQGVN